MKKQLLMTPGPTPIPQEVYQALIQQVVHHRTEAFTPYFKEAIALLKKFFKTDKRVYVFSASGTGAMEAAVVNAVAPGEKAIFAICGRFSERFFKIATAYGVDAVKVEVPWGEPFPPELLEKALKEHPDARAVFTIFNETSTGVYNDVKSYGEVVSRTDAILVVDGVSGIGAMPFYFDEWKVDIAVTGAQKAMMMPPGLAAVAVSDRAFERACSVKSPKFYWDFKLYEDAMNRKNPETPFTPPISMIYAMYAGLKKLVEEEGLEKAWERHARLGEATREAVKALGLELFPKANFSNSVTAVKVPEGVSDGDLRRLLKDKSVIVAGGQAHLKGKIFRIGHLGYVVDLDVLATIAALEASLAQLGYPVKLGSGVSVAQKVLYNLN